MTAMHFIGAALGHGSPDSDTEEGPHVLQPVLERYCQATHLDATWGQTVEPPSLSADADHTNSWPAVLCTCRRLREVVEATCQQSHRPMVIGGDHAIAMGTWPGVIMAHGHRQRFGLLWLDAHMDAHTPDTTPSNALHGMPVAGLLGHGESAWLDLLDDGPFLKPEDLVIFGARSFEAGEKALLTDLNVRIFYMDEIKERGIRVCFKEAMQHITANTDAFGVSVDLDGFDPTFAPGVGTPAPGGYDPKDMLPLLTEISSDSRLKAIEIAEYNPKQDRNHRTQDLVLNLVQAFSPPKR